MEGVPVSQLMNVAKMSIKYPLLLIFGYCLIASHTLDALKYAHISINAKTGRVYTAKDAEMTVFPASLTKMMTALILFEALEQGKVKPSTRITVSKNAASLPNLKLGVKAGKQVTIKEAVVALLTKSANDMGAAIGEHLANGSESKFATLMTIKARQLGMSKTTFKNASGVPHPAQITTARDMAILCQSIYKRFPKFYHLMGLPSFTYNGRTYKNSNKLLGVVEGMEGGKTGFTKASGHNLATSTKRNDVRIITVVIGTQGSKARDQRMSELVEATFDRIEQEKQNPRLIPVSSKLPTPVLAQNLFHKTAFDGSSRMPMGEDAHPAALSIPDEYFMNAAGTTSTQAHASDTFDETVLNARDIALDSKSWSIQVGAYQRVGAARQAAQNALKQLSPGLSTIAHVSVSPSLKKRKVYRARLIGFTQKQAKDACARIQKSGMACLAMMPAKSPKLYTAMNGE
jgi:D-alanyl-D-alanine carboxypeptidase